MKAVVVGHKRFSRWNRERKAEAAIEFGRANGVQSVLLVGVSADRASGDPRVPATNHIEDRLIEAFPNCLASGLGEFGTGWPAYVQANGLELPFADQSFDLVYSNAVIEHVGNASEQALFVREHVRVGRHWMLTTPNRLFPVEAHTFTFVRHMNPNWRPSTPVYTRLLSKGDLRGLLPAGAVIVGSQVSPTFTAHS